MRASPCTIYGRFADLRLGLYEMLTHAYNEGM